MNWLSVEKARYAYELSELIAYPTEAIWGLGCNPFDQTAVEALLDLKQRDWRKGLIVVFSDYAHLPELFEPLPQETLDTLKGLWPAPVTCLLPNNGVFPEWVTGGSDKIALRLSAHSTVKALCDMVGPLVSTSANISKHEPCRYSWQVRKQLGDTLTIIEGACGAQQQPSQIIDIVTGERLR